MVVAMMTRMRDDGDDGEDDGGDGDDDDEGMRVMMTMKMKMNLKVLLCKTRILPADWLRLCKDCHYSAGPRRPTTTTTTPLPMIPTIFRGASATAGSATAGWFSFDRKYRAAGCSNGCIMSAPTHKLN